MSPTRSKLLSIAIAAICGAAMSRLGLPLAWVIGPMVSTAILSLSGRVVFADIRARRTGQILVGAAIGLKLTASSLSGLWLWVPVAVILNFGALWVALLFGRLFARWLSTDTVTGYFAMVPGGLSEMSNVAGAEGGTMEIVAIVQALRVACTVCILPPLLLWLDLHGTFSSSLSTSSLGWTGLGTVLAAGGAGAWGARLLRMNNPWMIGALVGAACLSVGGLISGELPRLLFWLGQMMIGMTIGARFNPVHLHHIGQQLPKAITLILSMMALTAVIGTVFARVSGFDPASSVLAISPGGFSEMATTATTLHLNVALVTVFHVVRAFIINGFSAVFWRKFGA